MQNRLDGAAEAQAASENQLAELHSAIAAERAARPESVNFQTFIINFFLFFSLVAFLYIGSTLRGSESIGFCEENVD